MREFMGEGQTSSTNQKEFKIINQQILGITNQLIFHLAYSYHAFQVTQTTFQIYNLRLIFLFLTQKFSPPVKRNTQMKTLILLFSTALIFTQVSSVYFGISARPFCFDLDQEPGKVIKFSYEVTGQTPQQITVEIVPHDPSLRSTLTGANNKGDISGDYETSICFTSTDGKYKSVSVDFYTHDKAHLMQLAKKSQIYELHTKLIEVGENLKEISKNQQFEEERQIIHSEIIVGHENTIKYFAMGKLIVIIVVTVGQLYLLKAMLDKTSKGYMPV